MTIDDLSIRNEEVDHLEKAYEHMGRRPPERSELVLALVEERLLAREAIERGVVVSDQRIDEIIARVAMQRLMTVDELRQKVEATSGAPWEEYRRDLIRREREAQVLALDLLSLVPLRLPAWGGEEVEGLLKYRRKRCARHLWVAAPAPRQSSLPSAWNTAVADVPPPAESSRAGRARRSGRSWAQSARR